MTSGNRWGARLKGCAGLFDNGNGRFRGPIDEDVGNRTRQCRRRRGRRIGQSDGGHADGTEIVQSAVVVMAGLPLIGRHDRCNPCLGLMPSNRVHVTKGQRKVEPERDQRETRNKPNIVPKQTHPE
jgi:hypothetical protein